MGRVRGEETRRRERSQQRKNQKKEDEGARKGRKVATYYIFQCFVAPEGREVGSLKRRKHMSKSKCTKQHMFGLLLEVEMMIKCISL